jgi:hypothetical protein
LGPADGTSAAFLTPALGEDLVGPSTDLLREALRLWGWLFAAGHEVVGTAADLGSHSLRFERWLFAPALEVISQCADQLDLFEDAGGHRWRILPAMFERIGNEAADLLVAIHRRLVMIGCVTLTFGISG